MFSRDTKGSAFLRLRATLVSRELPFVSRLNMAGIHYPTPQRFSALSIATPTPVNDSPAAIPEQMTIRKRAVQFGAILDSSSATVPPMNIETQSWALMTNARPIAAQLGTNIRARLGRVFSRIGNTKPIAAAVIIAVAAPAGSASRPTMNNSATAFQVATAGAGHSGVMSCWVGCGMSVWYQ